MVYALPEIRSAPRAPIGFRTLASRLAACGVGAIARLSVG